MREAARYEFQKKRGTRMHTLLFAIHIVDPCTHHRIYSKLIKYNRKKAQKKINRNIK